MTLEVYLTQVDDVMQGEIRVDGTTVHTASHGDTTLEGKYELLRAMREWAEENIPEEPQPSTTASHVDETPDMSMPLPPMPKSEIPIPQVTYPPVFFPAVQDAEPEPE
jgi:hypothetical protein